MSMADKVVQGCSSSKTNQFQSLRTEEGKHYCLICKRCLASKQNILLHLHKLHVSKCWLPDVKCWVILKIFKPIKWDQIGHCPVLACDN